MINLLAGLFTRSSAPPKKKVERVRMGEQVIGVVKHSDGSKTVIDNKPKK